MADAKKCDRCVRLYEIVEMTALESAIMSLDIFATHKCKKELTVLFDLCDDCQKSFKKWWENKGENE